MEFELGYKIFTRQNKFENDVCTETAAILSQLLAIRLTRDEG